MSNSDDFLEMIKIVITLIIGYIIISSLLSIQDNEPIKCICNCYENITRLN